MAPLAFLVTLLFKTGMEVVRCVLVVRHVLVSATPCTPFSQGPAFLHLS